MTIGQRLTYSARMDSTGCIELLLPRWEGNVMVHDSQFMSGDDALALAKALTEAVAESNEAVAKSRYIYTSSVKHALGVMKHV
jgi:hypothetical protein